MGATFRRHQSNQLEFSPMSSMTSKSFSQNLPLERTKSNQEDSEILSCGICSPQKKKQSVVWREDFESCCKKLKEDFEWANLVKKAGTEKLQTRVNCMKDFQQLKQEFSKKIQNKQVPSPAEMRQLLSSSALLQQNIGQDRGRQSQKSFVSKSSFKWNVKSSFQGRPKGKGGKNLPMVSMLDQNMKSLFLPKKNKNIEEEVQFSIYLFVKFTELLEKHAQNPNNAICKMRLAFIKYIEQKYGSLTTLLRKQDQELTSSIRQFINLYTVTIEVYYKVSILTEHDKTRQIFSLQNIKSVATVILFKNDGFYKLVFKLYQMADLPVQQELEKIMQSKKNIKPEDLKVAPEYCLNELTVDWYLSKASLERNGLQQVEIPTNSECSPFETCIMKIKQIQEAQTPISKLKVIISTADKISSSINRFYQINNIPSHQMVDSDQVLTIFIYIVLHCKISNLKTHLRFIEYFCTQEQLMSDTGYYATVVEGALRLLLQQGDQECD